MLFVRCLSLDGVANLSQEVLNALACDDLLDLLQHLVADASAPTSQSEDTTVCSLQVGEWDVVDLFSLAISQ